MTDICSEVLCYIQNKFCNSTRAGLTTVISGVYSSVEIVAANLFCLMWRRSCRKSGDDKKRLDTDDILNLYVDLDLGKANLPRFTAADLSRIPHYQPHATDICLLTAAVLQLQREMASMRSQLSIRPVIPV